ncbi:AGAP009336-PA-like protein [Anopheles sinensis]|uniref:AGAP009336-PA-like protein n=1 Tax=Anopheles sinensis TaxID=74873 RepID=A0A084VM37_ANOSI|nr:AGAP009336-PA-like protein [Anopheles sinensis]
MAVKSKKPTPTKESPVVKVEKSKKKKKSASPKVDHVEKDVSEAVARKIKVNPPQDSDEKMATEGVVDPGEADKKPTRGLRGFDRFPPKPRAPRHELCVCVKNLKKETTDEDLAEFFKAVGKVVKVRYLHCKRAAFVRFEKTGCVERALALDNTSLKGWPVYVESMRPVKPSKNIRPTGPTEKQLKRVEEQRKRAAKRAAKREKQNKKREAKEQKKKEEEAKEQNKTNGEPEPEVKNGETKATKKASKAKGQLHAKTKKSKENQKK